MNTKVSCGLRAMLEISNNESFSIVVQNKISENTEFRARLEVLDNP